MKKIVIILLITGLIIIQIFMVGVLSSIEGRLIVFCRDMYEEVLSIDSRLDFIEWKMKGK